MGFNLFGGSSGPSANPNKNGPYNEKLTGDSMTMFMKSQQNQLANTGAAATGQGQQTYGAGLGALAPVLQQLTQLVHGDQAEVSQATQPQSNQIRDSFQAVRNMISQQPRGGGKAGALAEAPYKEQQQISDMQSQTRQGATGQLGSVASSLAGMGLQEEELGQRATGAAGEMNLTRRGQDMGPGSTASQVSSIISSIGMLI